MQTSKDLFEKFTLGNSWKNMDSAIYSFEGVRFAKGGYWFWFFTDFKTNHRLNVFVSKIGKKHLLNNTIVNSKKVGRNKFRGSISCWCYNNNSVKCLAEEECVAEVLPNKFIAVADSGLTLTCTERFPNYKIKLSKGEKTIADIKLTCSKFNKKRKNRDLNINCIESISKKNDGYFKADRTSQPPYMASKVVDLYTNYKGRLFGALSAGFVYMERVNAFGLSTNWSMLLARFKDNSQLFFREFMAKRLTYNFPLNFYFINGRTGKKYQFKEYSHKYYDASMRHSRKVGRHFWSKARFIELVGKSDSAKIKVIAEILNKYNHNYCSVGSKGTYRQLILKIKDFEFTADGVRKTLKDLKSNAAYGEHCAFAYFKGPWFAYTKARIRKMLRKPSKCCAH